MVNILVDDLPEMVEIDGEEVPINTDYRASLQVIRAFEDRTLADPEKIAVLLDNLYFTLPQDINKAYELGMMFLNGGESPEPDGNKPGPRYYSFNQDANLIFAAFRQTHGIDLTTATLHWWAFMALFMDLGADTAFCQLVAFRKRIKEGKATKEEKAMYREMHDQIDLENPDEQLTPDEQAEYDKFMAMVLEGNRKQSEKLQAQKVQSQP
jgi:hypothetical protein